MTLESALLKLDWADECIKVLEDEIRAFFENENYRVAANFNPDRISKGFTTFDGFVQSDQVGMWELSLQIRQEAPTRRWSLMVGDIVNNLRSCLNHCVYELAALASGQEPPPKFSGLKFLICRDEADFNGQTPKRLLNVPQGAVQVILSAQSFNDPQSALPILQSISNADKHHRIRLAVTFMREFSAFDEIGRASCRERV